MSIATPCYSVLCGCWLSWNYRPVFFQENETTVTMNSTWCFAMVNSFFELKLKCCEINPSVQPATYGAKEQHLEILEYRVINLSNSPCSWSNLCRLAILLLHGNYYTIYERRLKGYYRLKQRHLEILGYRVINLSDSLWNAMFMTEPKAKQEYLRNLIWPRDE